MFIKILLFSLFTLSAEAQMTELKPCPESPNCVSTQTDQLDKKMEPISFESSGKEVLENIKKIILAMPRTHLESEADNYLHFTFRSFIFRFVDDVEFIIDEQNKLIHFRSASRTGHSDFGVNRKRMDSISQQLK